MIWPCVSHFAGCLWCSHQCDIVIPPSRRPQLAWPIYYMFYFNSLGLTNYTMCTIFQPFHISVTVTFFLWDSVMCSFILGTFICLKKCSRFMKWNMKRPSHIARPVFEPRCCRSVADCPISQATEAPLVCLSPDIANIFTFMYQTLPLSGISLNLPASPPRCFTKVRVLFHIAVSLYENVLFRNGSIVF